MGGRFKNATPVTVCAFVAFFMFRINLNFGGMGGGLRQHDVVNANNYIARRKPSRRQ